MNTELLQRIREQVLLEPHLVNMAHVVRTETACGTTGCIVGWAMMLQPNADIEAIRFVGFPEYLDIGSDLLGITRKEADVLFHVEEWPAEYQARYWHGLESWPGFEGWNDAAHLREAKRVVNTHNAAIVAELLQEVINRGSVWWAKEKEDE